MFDWKLVFYRLACFVSFMGIAWYADGHREQVGLAVRNFAALACTYYIIMAFGEMESSKHKKWGPKWERWPD